MAGFGLVSGCVCLSSLYFLLIEDFLVSLLSSRLHRLIYSFSRFYPLDLSMPVLPCHQLE